MTGENLRFNGWFAGSLFAHLGLFFLLFLLPAPGNGELVTIYRVNVVEAPARPKVKKLTISTRSISELDLEAPSLNPEAPPLEAPQAPAAPEALPSAAPDPAAVPPPPVALTARPAPQGVPPPQGEAPAQGALPALPPVQPRAAPQARALEKPQGPPAPPRREDVAQPAPTPLEKLRPRVEQINLKIEQAPPSAPGVERPQGAGPSSLLSLRLFWNRVSEAIKENYSFPGSFESGLLVRVRLTIERDGTLSEIVVVTSSGNESFDYAAIIALRRTKFPPLPDGYEGATMTQVIGFSP